MGGFQNHLYALYGLPGGFISGSVPIRDDYGDTGDPDWHDDYDKKKRKKFKKGNFLTVEEMKDNKRLKRQQEEELILLLLKKDFDA
jgi:hypothetical protein